MPRPCKKLPSLKELHELLSVDYETGQLIWKPRPENPQFRAAGKVAGARCNRGYLHIQLGRGNFFLAHRIIFKMAHDLEPEFVDHIDRNKSNNALSNLRAASATENNLNQPLPSNNTTGCKGVGHLKSRNKWRVFGPKIKGKIRYHGEFDSREEAIAFRVGLYGESLCF